MEGVPAQKTAIVKPMLASNFCHNAFAFIAPATSHGFPMNTHGAGAFATRFSPSQGLAGAYREPAELKTSARDRLNTVVFKNGTSFRSRVCKTPCMPRRSRQYIAKALAAPPLDALYRSSASAA